MYVPRAMYSLSRSFWMVPLMAVDGTPRFSAPSWETSRRMAGGGFVVLHRLTHGPGVGGAAGGGGSGRRRPPRRSGAVEGGRMSIPEAVWCSSRDESSGGGGRGREKKSWPPPAPGCLRCLAVGAGGRSPPDPPP